MKNIKLKYIFILFSLLITSIYSQELIVKGDLIFNITDKIYSNYTGFSINGNFPLAHNYLYIGPNIEYFNAVINSSPERIPENASNRGLSLGLRAYYLPFQNISIKIIKLRPYLGLGLGYRFNHISSTTSFAYDIDNTIVFSELEDDLTKELFFGISFIPKSQNFLGINFELLYQFRKPTLFYTKSSGFEKIDIKNEINLNEFFLSIGAQLNI